MLDDNPRRGRICSLVLEAYRKTPGTMGTVRRPDRMLAAQLYQRGYERHRKRVGSRGGT
jgi:hypothetical protein